MRIQNFTLLLFTALTMTGAVKAFAETNHVTQLVQTQGVVIVEGDSTAQLPLFALTTRIDPNDHRPYPPPHNHPPYPPPPSRGSYYNWSRGNDGWGHCYEWASNGGVLNNGNTVSDYFCEQENPSRYDWGRGNDGWGYCYQYTPYGDAMNSGGAVSNYFCEQVARSYYSWGRGNDGYTHCYQYTARGTAMNQGSAVSDYYCQ